MKQVLLVFPSEEVNKQISCRAWYKIESTSLPCFWQDLLPELQAVCQCSEAAHAPVLPVGIPAEARSHEVEPKPERSSEVEQVPGTKRKRGGEDASAPPAKKILGDGTRSPSSPVTWRSSTTGIVIK